MNLKNTVKNNDKLKKLFGQWKAIWHALNDPGSQMVEHKDFIKKFMDVLIDVVDSYMAQGIKKENPSLKEPLVFSQEVYQHIINDMMNDGYPEEDAKELIQMFLAYKEK